MLYIDIFLYLRDLILKNIIMKKKLGSLQSKSLKKNTLVTIKGGNTGLSDSTLDAETLNMTNKKGVVKTDSVSEDC